MSADFEMEAFENRCAAQSAYPLFSPWGEGGLKGRMRGSQSPFNKTPHPHFGHLLPKVRRKMEA